MATAKAENAERRRTTLRQTTKTRRRRRRRKTLDRRPRSGGGGGGGGGGRHSTDTAAEAEVTAAETEATDHQGEGSGEVVAGKTEDRTDVQIRIKPHPTFKEIYNLMLEDGAQRLATQNLTPGLTVYGERLIHVKDVEYRIWDAFRSKLAGAIIKGLQTVPLDPGYNVLYLGAASGTTPSHVSDIVGEKGHVYCVEFAHVHYAI